MNFLYEKKTNLVYKYSAYKSRAPQIELACNQVWILGQSFKIDKKEKQSAEEIERRLERVLDAIAWFSYTKNFDPIPSDDPKLSITSDAGWGCMIRAGQMLLFTLLMRMFDKHSASDKPTNDNLKYFLLKAYFREKVGKGNSKVWLFGLMGGSDLPIQTQKPLIENSQLVENEKDNSDNRRHTTITESSGGDPPINNQIHFSKSKSLISDEKTVRSDELGIFSLQSFSSKALELFQKPLGNWFRPTTFLLILKQIMKKHPDFAPFKIHNIVENVFYLKSLYKKAFCATEEELLDIQSIDQCISELSTRKWKKKVVLSLTTLLGMDNTDERYQPMLSRLMEIGSFSGMLGGYQQSAYYFVGKKSSSEYYYLDPHYVKPSLDNFNDKGQIDKQYFDKKILEINYSKMCSSVSLVYFLEGCEDFASLISVLHSLEEVYKEDFFIAYFLEKLDEKNLENDIISF
jgi:hypothetical protein